MLSFNKKIDLLQAFGVAAPRFSSVTSNKEYSRSITDFLVEYYPAPVVLIAQMESL